MTKSIFFKTISPYVPEKETLISLSSISTKRAKEVNEGVDVDITVEYGNGKCSLKALIKINHADINFLSLYFSSLSLFVFFREYTIVSFFSEKLYYAYENRRIPKNHKTCTRKCYINFR